MHFIWVGLQFVIVIFPDHTYLSCEGTVDGIVLLEFCKIDDIFFMIFITVR